MVWTLAGEVAGYSPDPARTQFINAWRKAIDGIGAVQMGYMRKFYEEEHFEELLPAAVATVSPFGVSAETDQVDLFSHLATANPERSHIIINYNEHTRGGCRISGMKEGAYQAEWFDPRTGNRSIAVESFAPQDGCFDAPARTEGGDWVLVIKPRM